MHLLYDGGSFQTFELYSIRRKFESFPGVMLVFNNMKNFLNSSHKLKKPEFDINNSEQFIEKV